MSDFLRNQVEALLFSSGRAMKVEDIADVIETGKTEINKALKALKEFYDTLESGLMVSQEGDFWKLNIREQYVPIVTKIIADTELSKQVLETLSVIAWKSPALQSEIIKIRTSNAYEHIKQLFDAGFITKEKQGRSYKLRISEKFYEYFDVPGDKGIKEAFKNVPIPEKKEPIKLGDLNVVSIDGNSQEQGKTAEIFGDHSDQPIDESPIKPKEKEKLEWEDKDEDEVEEEKGEIPPVDDEFLEKINKKIDDVAKRNDELEDDELFKSRREDGETESVDTESKDSDSQIKSETSGVSETKSSEHDQKPEASDIQPEAEQSGDGEESSSENDIDKNEEDKSSDEVEESTDTPEDSEDTKPEEVSDTSEDDKEEQSEEESDESEDKESSEETDEQVTDDVDEDLDSSEKELEEEAPEKDSLDDIDSDESDDNSDEEEEKIESSDTESKDSDSQTESETSESQEEPEKEK